MLVLGAAGGVGITAVEIAKAMGARVIAAASSDAKLEFARSAGADETINYSTTPLKDTVKELTDGKGADVVYDPVGGELADQAFRATAGNFLIRGFGNGANNAGIEPSVGVFIDGVYRSRTASALADLPNLERIEVLRGPQSTLFGKNASAGVISVVTAKPSLDGYSGSATVTVGDYSQYIVKADITGPAVGYYRFQSFRQRQPARRLL